MCSTLTAEVTTKEHIGNYTHQAILNIPQPTLWNPEKPYLYTMLVECENEIITDRVGIRESSSLMTVGTLSPAKAKRTRTVALSSSCWVVTK